MNRPSRVTFTRHGAERCADNDRDQATIAELVLSVIVGAGETPAQPSGC